MGKVIIVAQTILGDEKAYDLRETHRQAPDHSGFHRYQVIRVVRNDRLAEWQRDMGLASNFKGINQMWIPSLLEHTVDELMALADELRGQPKLDVKDFLQLDTYKPA